MQQFEQNVRNDGMTLDTLKEVSHTSHEVPSGEIITEILVYGKLCERRFNS